MDMQEPKHYNGSAHHIAIESALASMEDFLCKTEEASSKGEGSHARKVSSIYTIEMPKLRTKAGAAFVPASDCDEIMYVVNFGEGEGFALLAADDRISDEIIAITDKGTMNEEQIYASFQRACLRDSLETKGNDTPCTSFYDMQFYDENSDDYYIGDYVEPNGGAGGILSHNMEVVADLCTGYVLNQINGFTPPCDTLAVDDVESEVVTTYSQPVVNKLLYQLYGWNQSPAPFNSLLPNCILSSQTAYAGCVNLAIAKIITYHSFPTPVVVNGVLLDWSAMKTNVYSQSGRASVASLISYVFSRTTSFAFVQGTFTLPSTARTCLQGIGYQNTLYRDYSAATVKQMLDDGCPVMVCSLPRLGFLNYDFGHSHAWNIDGYLNRTRTTTFYYYVGGLLDHTSSMIETSTMVHCDWGWGGNCNGYFSSGIFNLSSNSNVYDGYHVGHATNYNYYIKIISYDRPNR